MTPAPPPLIEADAALLARLKAILGPAGWIGAEEADKYLVDPRGYFHGGAALVARPASTGEVSALVAACNAARVGIVPFGAGTGGAAGHMETGGGRPIILSLERLNRIRSVDAHDNAIIAEAGCVLADIQAAALAIDRRFGLSIASEGSCTIGGNLASNAGGNQVLRYGSARQLCLGIEAVMPDGSILDDLAPLRKNNAGYDVKGLLIGSEGTLGVITAAALKLSPRPEESVTAICAVSGPVAALDLLDHIRGALGECVTAFELMSGFGIRLAVRHFPDLADPFERPHDWCVLANVESAAGLRSRLETVLAEALQSGAIADAVLAQSESQAATLWRLRELSYEYNRKEGVIYSSDTAVPTGRIADFIELTDAALREIDPALRVNRYGHVGDGNIHVNVFPPSTSARQNYLDERPDIRRRLQEAINLTTLRCGGSISAEHGVGRLKVADLARHGDPAKLAAMRAIKTALDPNGVMNPGAVFAV